MGKKSAPKAPDLSPISDAQLQIARESNDLARKYLGLSEDQFAFMKDQAGQELDFARQQAAQQLDLQQRGLSAYERTQDLANKVGQSQLDAMNEQMGWAREDRDRYKQVFQPLQDQLVQEAQGYDTPARREQAASQALADTNRQAEAARASADARLRSMGIDPSQVASTSMANQLGVGNAAAAAFNANNARLQVENTGRALKANAVNMGAGLPAQALGAAGQSVGAGSAAVGSSGAPSGQLGQIAGLGSSAVGLRSGALGNYASLTGSPMQWANMGQGAMGMASNSYNNAANTMTQGYQNQLAGWQAGQQAAQSSMQTIGSVAGMAAMFMAEGGAVPSRPRYYAEGDFVLPDMPQDQIAVDAPHALAISDLHPSLQRGIQSPELSDGAQFRQKLGKGLMAADMILNSKPDTPPVQLENRLGYHYFAEGGTPGALPVPQGRDKIHAFLTGGEYIVPPDVVRSKGIEFFDKLVSKYHRPGA